MILRDTVERRRLEQLATRVKELRGERSRGQAMRQVNLHLLRLRDKPADEQWLLRIEHGARAALTAAEVDALAMGLTSTPAEADAVFRELRGLMGWAR